MKTAAIYMAIFIFGCSIQPYDHLAHQIPSVGEFGSPFSVCGSFNLKTLDDHWLLDFDLRSLKNEDNPAHIKLYDFSSFKNPTCELSLHRLGDIKCEEGAPTIYHALSYEGMIKFSNDFRGKQFVSIDVSKLAFGKPMRVDRVRYSRFAYSSFCPG